MERSGKTLWAGLLVVCLGFFVTVLDTTIVYIATPSLLRDLHTTFDGVLWVINAYLLSYAVLLVTAGRLGDAFGLRRMFALGLVVFTIGSALSGAAADVEQLIGARVVQGVGAALLTPQSLALLSAIFPRERMGAALGIWSAVVGLAAVAGPTLGGLIVTSYDWRWIFYVNVPIGVLAFVGTYLLVPDVRPNRRHRIDVVGMLLSALGLAAIVFALVEGERYRWGVVAGPLSIPVILIGGLVALGAFFVWQGRQAEPVIPGALLGQRNYLLMNVVAAAVYFSMQSIYIPISIYLQSVRGLSALDTGFAVVPISLSSMFVAPLAGRLADRVGGKFLLAAGLVLVAGGAMVAAQAATLTATAETFRVAFIVIGVGLGLTFAPMAALAMREIAPAMTGAASGVFNTSRQLGAALGAAAIGAIIQMQLATALPREAATHAATLPDDLRRPFIDAFARASEGGFEVGVGQSGGAQLPAGLAGDLAARFSAAAADTFGAGFIEALQTSVVIPVAVLGAGLVASLLVSRPTAARVDMPTTARSRAG